MRALFMAIVVVGICGCAKPSHIDSYRYTPPHSDLLHPALPYFDLRYPIYLVTDKSFLSGCEHDVTGYKTCRADRVKIIYEGINQWFDYFSQAIRPQVVVVFSEEQVPEHLINDVIHLGISASFCGKDFYGKDDAGACYSRSPLARMVFKNAFQIKPRLTAHEFGHVLGRGDNDVRKGVKSVMSYDHPTPVLLLDIKMMCRLHRECRMVNRKLKKH